MVPLEIAVIGNVLDSWGSNNANPYGPVIKNNADCAIGSCLLFDGVDDYITIANAENFQTNDGTASAWIKLNSIIDGEYLIAKTGTNGWSQLNWHIRMRTYNVTTGWSAAIGDGAGDWVQTGVTPTTIGKWYFVAIKWWWDATAGKTYLELYIDGVSQASANHEFQILGFKNPLQLYDMI